MTDRRHRALVAAAELTQRRRRRRFVELPDAHHPTRTWAVDPPVVDVRDQYGFGAPVGEEYAVTGWRTAVADRAQDFQGGTIYLDTTTGQAGFFSWRPYTPLRADPRPYPRTPGCSRHEP